MPTWQIARTAKRCEDRTRIGPNEPSRAFLYAYTVATAPTRSTLTMANPEDRDTVLAL